MPSLTSNWAPALFSRDGAQFEVSEGITRAHAYGGFECLCRFVELPQMLQRHAETELRARQLAGRLQGLAKRVDGIRVLSRLVLLLAQQDEEFALSGG